ncbi:MAG: hypothetical protein MRJ96_16895 [Nitrospirales bacterium]|nr:hypothetical protein [Nitrospira sp.]MDR4503123.1 hypothetical protein [Nitrospirales bacterium]
MHYLNAEMLESLPSRAFQQQTPYPWINPYGMLYEDRYRSLLETLPEQAIFTSTFGRARKYGQKSHDRYTLKYRKDLSLARPWAEFIQELQGQKYGNFLKTFFQCRSFELDFFWFYTPNGCSISPHCDHKNKIGAHLFYMNTEQDWSPEWGGETLILDDGGKLERKSAPSFDEFSSTIPSKAIGNYSLLFARTENSWHGMKEIRCPENRMRRVFMVAIKRHNPLEQLSRFFGLSKKPVEEY